MTPAAPGLDDHRPAAAVERLHAFEDELRAECARLGRPRADVTLIVVTKYQPLELIRALRAAGQVDFGENIYQQLRTKVADPELAGARWHYIGQLQRNKARHVGQISDLVHSVDRPEVVERLADPGREQPLGCFVEINLADAPQRGGVEPDGLLPLARQIAAAPGLDLRGVMGVAPLDVPAGDAFARFAEHSARLRTEFPTATAISAGMSADWRDALRHGATHLRIGTTITGKRPSTA